MLRLLLGNNPLFQVPQYQLVSPWELGIYALLGLAGGFVSVAFTKLLLWMRARFLRFPKKTVWFQPVAGGVMVGVMGWFVPQLLGVGYKHVGEALNGGMALRLMILLLVLKLLAVATCYASGNAGGIFGPSLFLGAMLGGIVGTIASHFLPATVGTPGAYALVGMGTAFAGIVRAPMTSVLMIFEITRDYAVIVPLMISNLVSFYISSKLQRKPIYEGLAQQDGIHLPSAETRQEGEQRQVSQAMRPATEILRADMTLQEATEKTKMSPVSAWVVSDQRGVRGVLSRKMLEQAAKQGSAEKRLEELITTGEFIHVHPDHPLAVALERLGASRLEILPVVSRANVHQLEGILTLQDMLALYGVGERGKAESQETS
jgi:CIC family chloride channel protein